MTGKIVIVQYRKIMNRKKIILIALVIVAFGFLWFSDPGRFLTFENLKQNREMLQHFVNEHYMGSVFIFILIFMSTAFIIPGAIIISVAGGLFYGVLLGMLYINIGSTVGATMAFLTARYLIGQWVQKKYHVQMETFNREIDRHGTNYLVTLRIVPVLPFFMVNYLAGLTRISTKKFFLTTAIGMIPGSLIYSFAGQQFSEVTSPEDITSPGLIIALMLLGIFALLPVIVHHINRIRSGRETEKK
jgi:uncharacterized membrane protein YdjX (TVP38/TMEM64 family)